MFLLTIAAYLIIIILDLLLFAIAGLISFGMVYVISLAVSIITGKKNWSTDFYKKWTNVYVKL